MIFSVGNNPPLTVDVSYWFSGDMVKGQGQIAGLYTNDVPSVSFDPFVPKLGTVDAPREWICPMNFQVTWSKVKVKLLVVEKMLSTQYLETLLLESCQTWYNECNYKVDVQVTWSKVKVKLSVFEMMLSAQYLESTSLEGSQTWYNECLYRVDDTYWYSVYMVKGQGHKMVSTQYLLTPVPLWIDVVCSISSDHLTERFPNLVQWMPLQSGWYLLIFSLHGQRLRSKWCPLNIFWLYNATVDAPREEMTFLS